MKTLLFLILSASVVSCADLGVPTPPDDISNFTGTVVKQSGDFYLIYSDTRYQGASIFFPENLSSSFRSDGLRIRFSGRLNILPNVQYAYAPLTLTFISIIQQ